MAVLGVARHEFLGYREDEVVGRHLTEFLTEADMREAGEMLLRRIEDECKHECGELIQTMTEHAQEEANGENDAPRRLRPPDEEDPGQRRDRETQRGEQQRQHQHEQQTQEYLADRLRHIGGEGFDPRRVGLRRVNDQPGSEADEETDQHLPLQVDAALLRLRRPGHALPLSWDNGSRRRSKRSGARRGIESA